MPRFKKYIVFQYDDHYPSGGLGDITGSFDTIEEAKQHIKQNPRDENEIVDRDTWETVQARLVISHQRTELYHGDQMVALWNRSFSAEEVESISADG